jgi:hypothetical protein
MNPIGTFEPTVGSASVIEMLFRTIVDVGVAVFVPPPRSARTASPSFPGA